MIPGRMSQLTPDGSLTAGNAALTAGRWQDARAAFETSLTGGETAQARFGLAAALWWLGENRASVAECTRSYSLSRQSGDVGSAVHSAVWLGIMYKANFANTAAANGWIARADRMLESLDTGPLHGWSWVARAYRMPDLVAAEQLASRAVEVARRSGDVDLELVALAQLGLIRVGAGEIASGFALIDEAMAAALAGERTSLDTVVYACCDMLNACELTSDLERAAQWCRVADEFVATYGCPFLYAECRIYYGSVLAAKGRWADAERELAAGLQMTADTCPGLHAKGLTRLAGLRIRQGRLEEAEQLLSGLGQSAEADDEAALSRAALLLARGEASAASRRLVPRLPHLTAHRTHLALALEMLADAYLAAGDIEGAATTAQRLAEVNDCVDDRRLGALAAAVQGRVAGARGDSETAATQLETALKAWSNAELPFEAARTRFDLSRVLAAGQPEAAVEQARRALATFDTLGAAIYADRVAAFLRSLGVPSRTGHRGVGVLTVRELEVLRLVGAGLSNPEIAERLYVSRKTAAHHVSNILAKLQLRNRAEMAAYAVGSLGPAGPAATHQP